MVRSLEDIKPFVVVVGPTASGKSDLGMRLCKEFDGEIISCDSVQVYRDLNIGAAKPSLTDQSQVPHHLIDVADVGQDYDAGRFAKDARQSIFDIQQRGKLAVVVGGTGLYLRGLLGDRFHENLPKDVALRQRLAKKPLHQLYKLLQRLDDERALELHPNDRVRIERALELRILLGHPVSQLPPLEEGLRAKAFLIYLNPPPDLLKQKITNRAQQMLAEGLIEEVKQLYAKGVTGAEKPMQSIGYLQVVQYLAGQIPDNKLVDAISVATARYAKRQRTWFKKLRADLEVSDAQHAWVQVLNRVQAFLQAVDTKPEVRSVLPLPNDA